MVWGAVLSAGAAFGATVFAARRMLLWFQKRGLTKTPIVQQDGALAPGETAPVLGGLPMALGLLAGGACGLIAELLGGSSPAALTAVSSARVVLGLLLGAVMAAAGLLSDYRESKGLAGLSRPATLVLWAAAGAAYLLGLILCGDRSTLFSWPFLGQADLGAFYHPLCLLLILGGAAGGEALAETDGAAATAGMGAGMALALAAGLLGSSCGVVLGFSLAGCALGILRGSFPPVKLRVGKGGGMLLGGAAAAAALGIGVPALFIPAALPWLAEGLFALLRVCRFALTGRDSGSGSLGGWFTRRGLSPKAVSAVYMGLSAAGILLTAVSALKL